jgi:HEAT repeat protein
VLIGASRFSVEAKGVDAMGLFGPPNIKKMEARRDIKGLVKALKHKDLNVRLASVIALGKLGDVQGVEPLITVLKEGNVYMSFAAAEALGKLGDARAVEPLINALVRVGYMPKAAEEALVNLGSLAVEPLIASLKDRRAGVPSAGAEVLGMLGDARAVEPLIALLNHQDYHARFAAAEALGKLGDERAVEPLIAMLKDADWYVCETAAGALERLHWQPGIDETGARYWLAKSNLDQFIKAGAPAIEPLIAMLKGSDVNVHPAAAQGLGKLGDERAVEPLIVALNGGNLWVRSAAADALEKLHWQPGADETGAKYWIAKNNWDQCAHIGAPAVEPLLDALKNSIWSVRSKAAGTLVKMYKTGALDERTNNMILQLRTIITEPKIKLGHTDGGGSSDCSRHTDDTSYSGIGIDFPI